MGKYLHKFSTDEELNKDYKKIETLFTESFVISGGPMFTNDYGTGITSAVTHEYDGEYTISGVDINYGFVYKSGNKTLYSYVGLVKPISDFDEIDAWSLEQFFPVISMGESEIVYIGASGVTNEPFAAVNSFVLNGLDIYEWDDVTGQVVFVETTHDYDGWYGNLKQSSDGQQWVYTNQDQSIKLFLVTPVFSPFDDFYLEGEVNGEDYFNGLGHIVDKEVPNYIEPWVSLTEEYTYLKSFSSMFGTDYSYDFEYQGMGECYPYGRKHIWKSVNVDNSNYIKYVATNANDFVNYNINEGGFVCYDISAGSWRERNLSVNNVSDLVYDDVPKVHYNHDKNNYVRVEVDWESLLETYRPIFNIVEVGPSFNNDMYSKYYIKNLYTGEEFEYENGPIYLYSNGYRRDISIDYYNRNNCYYFNKVGGWNITEYGVS